MTVTTRRERRERELRKRQREKRGGHPSRGGGGGRGLLIGAGVVVLVLVAIFGLRQAGVLSLAPAASASPVPTGPPIAADDPARGVLETDQSNSHVPAGTPVTYAALPPTSGSHWPQPAAPVKAGVYDTPVPFEATTHNLEHGGIVIVYNGLSATELTQLKQFVNDTITRTRFAKVLLMPYTGLTGAKVTATSWDYRLNLQTVDTASLTKFMTVHYDQPPAPEPGAAW
ncbi:MAG: hypothetical protein QOH08_2482 [Chloroflexota bacterium]|jgi:hypothetical protein|nr:hypothetical protein [Chloroflexota bacterium]